MHIRTGRNTPILDYADRLKGYGLSTLEASLLRQKRSNDLILYNFREDQVPFTPSFSTLKPSRILIESKATRTFTTPFSIVLWLFITSLFLLIIFRWMNTAHFANFWTLTYLILSWKRLKGFKAVRAYSWINKLYRFSENLLNFCYVL